MQMPVISSVGHETDTTLADLVADARAATPTAAAEYATPNLVEVLTQISQLRNRLVASMQGIIRNKAEQVKRLKNSPVLRDPSRIYDEPIQRVDMLKQRLFQAQHNILNQKQAQYNILKQQLWANGPQKQLEQIKQQTSYLRQNLNRVMLNYLKEQRNKFAGLEQKLDDNSPLKTISRGYVYTENEAGTTVTSVAQLKVNEVLKLQFKDGQASAKVTDIRREENARKEK